LVQEFARVGESPLILGRLRGSEAPLFDVRAWQRGRLIGSCLAWHIPDTSRLGSKKVFFCVIASLCRCSPASYPRSLHRTSDPAQNLHKHCFMSTFAAP
jgi:hypothetical protein